MQSTVDVTTVAFASPVPDLASATNALVTFNVTSATGGWTVPFAYTYHTRSSPYIVALIPGFVPAMETALVEVPAYTPTPKHEPRNPKSQIPNPRPQTLRPKPVTRENRVFQTLNPHHNPQPKTLTPTVLIRCTPQTSPCSSQTGKSPTLTPNPEPQSLPLSEEYGT